MSDAVTPLAATRAWIGSVADKNGWITPLSAVIGAAVASGLFADPSWWRCALGVLAILLGSVPKCARRGGGPAKRRRTGMLSRTITC